MIHNYDLERDDYIYSLELELDIERGIAGDQIHAPEPPYVSIESVKWRGQPFLLTLDEEKKIEAELTEMLEQGEL